MSKKLMTHMVYGFPNRRTSINLMTGLDKIKVDYIEIQIPFSDPTADGSIITVANHIASQKTSTDVTLRDIRQATSQLKHSKAIVMCYFHTIYSYGLEKFIEDLSDSKVKGIIVPDLPTDQPEYKVLLEQTAIRGINLIPVLSPNMPRHRLRKYIERNRQVYVTARSGITGQHTERHQLHQLSNFLDLIKQSNPDIEIMVGFGIQTPGDIKNLPQSVDTAVVGSALMDHLKHGSIDQVIRLANKLSAACKQVSYNKEKS